MSSRRHQRVRVHVGVGCTDHVQECLLRDPLGPSSPRRQSVFTMPPLMFAASVTVTKAREAKTVSAFLVYPRSPAGTMRTAVSSRFHT